MSLHTHTVNPGSLGFLHIFQQLHDPGPLGGKPFVIIIVVQFHCRVHILIGVAERVDDKFIALVHSPPAAVLRSIAVTGNAVADSLIDHVPAVKHTMVLAVLAGEMFRHGLDIPFQAAVHGIGIRIGLIRIIVLMEPPLRRLGMPYQHMAPHLDKIIRMVLVPVVYGVQCPLGPAVIHLGNFQGFPVQCDRLRAGAFLVAVAEHGIGL